MKLDEQGLRLLIRWLLERLDLKVDAQAGKELSDNNFTDAFREILEGSYDGNPGLVPSGEGAGEESYLRSDGVWAQPFGRIELEVIPEQTVETGASGMAELSGDAAAVPESGVIEVVFDGQLYTLELSSDSGGIIAGNRYFLTGNHADDSSEPLCLVSNGEALRLYTDSGKTHTIRGTVVLTRVIDPEYTGTDMDPISNAEIDLLFAETLEGHT